MKNRVLKLLLLARPMDTTALWRDALRDLQGPVDVHAHAQVEPAHSTEAEDAAIPASISILDAVDAVVPHLPEYSSIALQLETLLEFCKMADPFQTNQMLRIWLQRGASSTSSAFRTWLLEWICTKKPFQRSGIQEDDDSKRHQQQWQHALYAAVVMEEQMELKRTLVKLLHELGPMRVELESPLQNHELQRPLASVEELLDFYWDHVHGLAPFTLLCAAKLQALASSQTAPESGSTRGFLQLTDGVLVRLRWSKLLKPVFFQGLLDHCVALKVIQTSASVDTFDLHGMLQLQVKQVSWTTRNKLLERLGAVKARLQDACKANAAHFSAKDPTSTTSWTATSQAHGKAFISLAENQQRLVLLDLERDLEDAPSHLFRHILLSFGVIVSSILSSDPKPSDAVLCAAIKSLFAIFNLRTDSESVFQTAALVVELQLTRHPIWTRVPTLFAEAVEALNEALAIEADAQKRWVLTTVLQQLLFECDPAAVSENLPTLAKYLPPRLLRLTRIRLQAQQRE